MDKSEVFSGPLHHILRILALRQARLNGAFARRRKKEGRYDGATLRAIRAQRGVGGPGAEVGNQRSEKGRRDDQA